MIEAIKHFFNLLFDNSRSWGFRTAAGISIIASLILADWFLNFSFDIQMNYKINQLEKIQNIKKEYKNDTLKLNKVMSLEKRILYKEHYTEFLLRNIKNISVQSNEVEEIIQDKTKYKIRPKRSVFWMAVTSNYLFILVFPFLLFLPLYGKDSRTANAIVGWFASLIMIGGTGVFVTWISFQIPLIYNNPIYNYILNFIIHSAFWFLIIKFWSRKNN